MRAAIDQALTDAGLPSPQAGRAAVVTAESSSLYGGATPAEFDRFATHVRACTDAVGLGRGDATRYFCEHGPPETVHVSSRLQPDLAQVLGDITASFCIEATCSTGIRVIAEAARILQLGKADIAVAAASSSRITPYLLGTYGQMMALSRWRGPAEEACRPFDRRRDGMVPGEAAGSLILETRAHAEARGVRPYARVAGWAFATGFEHPTRPEVAHMSTVIRAALERSQRSVDDIDLVNAHGTSTPLNDLSEAKALREVLGPRAQEVGVSACKSILGHSSIAASIVESIAAICSMRDGIVAPVPTCREPDPACNLPVSTEPLSRPLSCALKNAFGFGGQYGAMVLEKL
jgi:3-oxoacyl-[acyl-carrier-protein] synthase II